MIKVIMKDSEDLLIDGNHIDQNGLDYLIINRQFNGLFSQDKTVAVIKMKDVKMIYELRDKEVVPK